MPLVLEKCHLNKIFLYGKVHGTNSILANDVQTEGLNCDVDYSGLTLSHTTATLDQTSIDSEQHW